MTWMLLYLWYLYGYLTSWHIQIKSQITLSPKAWTMKQMHKQGLLNRQVLRLWYLIWEVENPHLRSWPTSSKCILVGLIFFFRYLNNWLPSQRVWTMHPPRVLTLSSIRAFDKFLQQITYLDLSPKISLKGLF